MRSSIDDGKREKSIQSLSCENSPRIVAAGVTRIYVSTAIQEEPNQV